MSELKIMYNIRPIITHDTTIEMPNCMYKTKNILATSITAEDKLSVHNHLDISQQGEITSEMSLLQLKQEKILRQLDELKQQMLHLKTILDIPEKNIEAIVKQTSVSCNEIKKYGKKEKICETVLYVHPMYPPYSLLSLKKLWSQMVRLDIKSYVHSTVTSLPDSTSEFVRLLGSYEDNLDLPYIFIRLIWKNIDEKLIMISNGTTQIHGEVNLLRYLSRMGPTEYNYEHLKKWHEVNAVMDICYLLGRAKTKTERHSLLQSLYSKLGKSQWLCDEKISIADVAASSVIKQVCASEVNVTLGKWLSRCESI